MRIITLLYPTDPLSLSLLGEVTVKTKHEGEKNTPTECRKEWFGSAILSARSARLPGPGAAGKVCLEKWAKSKQRCDGSPAAVPLSGPLWCVCVCVCVCAGFVCLGHFLFFFACVPM